MSFKVAIKNYQIISDANLSFDEGLTLITGPSNNGKSSIIRSIEALIYNKAGNSFIKQGEPATMVGVIANGHKVLWKKTKDGGEYRIDGEIYNKVGRGQLEEVVKALGISEVQVNQDKVRINFLKQMEFPFLLDKNPSQLFEFLSMSNDTDKLAAIFKTMRSDLKQNDSEINVEIGRIDSYKKMIAETKSQLCQYQGIEEIRDRVLSYDGAFNLLNTKVSEINYLRTTLADLKQKQPIIIERKQKFKEFDDSISVIPEPTALLEKEVDLNTLKSMILKLNPVKANYETLKEGLTKYAVLDEIPIEIIQEKYRIVSEGQQVISALRSEYNTIMNKKNGIMELREQLAACEKELEEFNVCPLCGNNLEGGNNDEHRC